MLEARRQKLQTRNWEPETKNQRGAEHLNELAGVEGSGGGQRIIQNAETRDQNSEVIEEGSRNRGIEDSRIPGIE
jgi:hypothetical protein